MQNAEIIMETDDKALGAAKACALRILGKRALSAREMENRLKSKGESEEIAARIVEWLVNIGLVNDEEYAESIVSHYCAKGYGPAKIRNELFRRGIEREMWDEVMNGAADTESAVYDYLNKRLKGSRESDDLRKAHAALCARGFSYSDAHEAINRYLESVEEEEGADL
jgi:regulatory protein